MRIILVGKLYDIIKAIKELIVCLNLRLSKVLTLLTVISHTVVSYIEIVNCADSQSRATNSCQPVLKRTVLERLVPPCWQ